MHDAVVSKLIAASRGSPCDSMASCLWIFAVVSWKGDLNDSVMVVKKAIFSVFDRFFLVPLIVRPKVCLL